MRKNNPNKVLAMFLILTVVLLACISSTQPISQEQQLRATIAALETQVARCQQPAQVTPTASSPLVGKWERISGCTCSAITSSLQQPICSETLEFLSDGTYIGIVMDTANGTYELLEDGRLRLHGPFTVTVLKFSISDDILFFQDTLDLGCQIAYRRVRSQ